MSEDFLSIVIVYAFLEYLEFSNQRGNSLKELLYTNFLMYQDSALRYFALHSTFFFLLYLSVSSGFGNIWFMSALLFKGFDLGLKLYVIGKIQTEGEKAVHSLIGKSDMATTTPMKLISSAMYISLVTIGFLE